MTPVRTTTVRLDEDILAALNRIKERDGIPVSEQTRRALAMWIEQKGEKVPAKKKTRRT